ITNTSDVAIGMLLGQDKDLVSADVKLNFVFDQEFKIPVVPPILSILLQGHAEFHVMAKFGYDTHGFREAIAPLYDPSKGSFDVSKTADGFWISPDTQISASGGMHAGADVDVGIAEGSVTGGFTLDLKATISNTKQREDPNKIRPF